MLSVVVNFFNNRREAKRTLHSMTRGYQRDAASIPFEVIALDHGSSKPLSEDEVRAFGPEFRYRFIRTTSVSPLKAINAACRDAAGEHLLVVVDGAHILSPGIYRSAQAAFRLFPSAFLATLPFHLGPKKQNDSILEGYNQEAEDALLQKTGWEQYGYKLYGAAGALSDGSGGWFGCLYESSCWGISKADYFSLGGLDERYQLPGGGLANLHFFQCALERPDLEYVMLLGEATFHQVHGGVASNAPPSKHPWAQFHEEYTRIRGKPFERVARKPFFLGRLPQEAFHVAKVSTELGLELWKNMKQPVRDG